MPSRNTTTPEVQLIDKKTTALLKKTSAYRRKIEETVDREADV